MYKIIVVLILVGFLEAKKCVEWSPKLLAHDDPSMVYSETASEEAGIGAHLSVYAMLWTLRRSYNVDVFISQACHDKLVTVFTPQSLDIPILEEYFCHPDKLPFAYWNGPFDEVIANKDNRVGKFLWLWPKTEVVEKMYNTDKKVKVTVEGDDFDSKFRYYTPDHHDGPRHAKLEREMYKWMKRILHFRPEVRSRVDQTLNTIARKMDLKASSEVTFVGIHNRRSSPAVDHWKKYHGQKPLKKSYFYDAMEEMRESYDNVAFLYVSDNMKWGRANIKDKENDLYFVGQNDEAFDFALLCQCNHTIISRGAYSSWVGHWTGGEYYTEYGSIVPNEVNDAIEEELREQNAGKTQQKSFVYSNGVRDPEGLLFPDVKLEGQEGQKAAATEEDSSWFW